MVTRLEAPGQEPLLRAAGSRQTVSGRRAPGSAEVPTGAGHVDLAAVSRAFGDVRALDGIDLHVAPREVVALVGPSGCGKTTLLELVCGLQSPDAGSVRSDPAVLMPQRDGLLPWCSAIDNAALAPRLAGASRAQARARAHPLFAAFGLEGFERAPPYELSGGMRQRVAFLRTLLSGKPVLCLDEPFGALDALTRREMQEWLARALEREPRTVLLVTHDVEEAATLADRVLVMSPRPGRVVAELGVPASRTATEVLTVRERALEALRPPPPAPTEGAEPPGGGTPWV
jgi:ABC-type nitrate/sulfonate/bicarbonate transport system ATPase subunit